MPSNFSAQEFFETQSPPSNLASIRAQATEFVKRHQQEGRNVVLVTSGGTTVPLEQNVVRFLDNFSAGTRGATSAEYFLSAGYAVIFMHRQHSLSPFTRHYSHTTNPFLDLLSDPDEDAPGSSTSEEKICVQTEHSAQLRPVLRAYHRANRAGTLLRLSFVTVNDYLFMLREMSQAMQPLGRKGMYYLAAAVSDFFVPSTKVPKHKIQSGKGSLMIEMDQVPKVLKPMVQDWAPEGFIVSFKLETDPNLLIPKARGALERYGHQVVIGNDLNRRKLEVVFVQRTPKANSKSGTKSTGSDEADYSERWLRLSEMPPSATSSRSHIGDREIEEGIVQELCTMHQTWVEQGQTPSRM
ncbi:Phosphopantothenate--cysteine ligase cab2 [Tilletia horrida]|uniref:Phosphopantothenate--cysteine ligase cab2 n=1 Tax=Tilletia horrida TaxID=155126 RepID=A0AAN6JS35_9BASI|nr:Phosphopantothenate--cysteine ligase cab2 [Tilletia horrida]KAK0563634.1 Phosphopantothenate--cysteine ligase cab2 [Tilletia horrida]